METGTHFRKSARPRYGLPDRFCLLRRIPNPLENPLTTYNTAQGGFDEDLKEILQKVFLLLNTGKFGKCQIWIKKNRSLYELKCGFRVCLYSSTRQLE